jgi:shikimate dehydrogenase
MIERAKFGLIGKDISYSFSKKYFSEKFKKENLDTLTYRNFDFPEIEEFPFILYHKEEEFGGFNVTIPYKESIMKYLSDIDLVAKEIGAVNTIKITKNNELVGYNTDAYGFENTIKPLLKSNHKRALILGTGGASKAIAYVLKNLNVEFIFVSRNPNKENEISYDSISKEIIETHQLIINCTPLGTFPNIEGSPNLPYEYITNKHVLFDLIYNPEETRFLSKGKSKGATIKNGYQMLEFQAEKSWEIWNS